MAEFRVQVYSEGHTSTALTWEEEIQHIVSPPRAMALDGIDLVMFTPYAYRDRYICRSEERDDRTQLGRTLSRAGIAVAPQDTFNQ